MRLERRDLVACAALALLGCCAFIHLMAVPVFEDEATQLRWIDRAMTAGEWLQALSEGKPLEVWPMVPLARLSPAPLPAIRALHVLLGICGAVLTYLLARRLGNRLQAFVCGVLFAICPCVVYLQRLAMADMLLCTAGIAVLLGTLALCESPTRSRAWGLAFALVLAVFCKLPVGFVFVIALPLALALMPAGERRARLSKPAAATLLVSQGPVLLLALAVAAVLVIQVQHGKAPGFGLRPLRGIALGGYAGIPTGTGLPRPTLPGELTAQLSWPVTLIGIVGLTAGALFNDWRHRWLLATGALPLLAIGLLANYWFSRYLLFTLPPLIIAAVAGWAALARRAGRFRQPVNLGILAICAALMGWQSWQLIVNPIAARWSPLDRLQYFEGWSSGYGYPAAARFLATAGSVPATLFSLDGHSAYQLLTYLPAGWSHRVKSVMYGDEGRLLRTEQQRLDNLLAHAPTWIVISPQVLDVYLTSSFGPAALEHLRLRRIASFDKPGGRVQLDLYEVTRP